MPTVSTPLRMDFDRFEVVDTHSLPELPAPAAGITRRMIERDGGEVARATSVVRYAPGATFAHHGHDLGEEILVLEGSFEDEHGSYATGTYLRNPPGSSHQPRTEEGCLLFVKLRHLQPDDQQRVVLDTRSGRWQPGLVPGLMNQLLAAHGEERTVLVRWAAGTQVPEHTHSTVEETLVLEGEICDAAHRYPAGTWFRAPRGSTHAPFSPNGALILIKVGHIQP
ncbi:MAG: cupin domain-containing protein [Pseudomonadales bacterium]